MLFLVFLEPYSRFDLSSFGAASTTMINSVTICWLTAWVFLVLSIVCVDKLQMFKAAKLALEQTWQKTSNTATVFRCSQL